jgi:hypothetical protein
MCPWGHVNPCIFSLGIVGLRASIIFIYWHSNFSSETTFDQAEVVSRWGQIQRLVM